ncbi:MAG: DMT family transporter [Oligoflexia bacterium]|nr:DMT family transporter [Oligoflexia bacterium]
MVSDQGEKMTPNPKAGYGWAALVTALWAFSGVLIKSCPLDALTISGGRGGLALVIVLLVATATRQRWSPRNCLQWPILLAGVTGGASCLAFVLSLSHIPIGLSIVLVYGANQFMPWVERLVTGRKVTRADKVTVGLVVLGLAVIGAQFHSDRDIVGSLWALACGVLYVFAIALRALRPNLEVEVQVSMYAWTLGLSLPHFLLSWDPRILTWEAAWPLLGNGLTHGLVLFAMVRALRHLSATTATFVTTLEIVVSPALAFAVLGEVPSTLTVVGGMIVLGAIVYNYGASRRQQ